MKKIILDSIIIGFLILITPLITKAQLFECNELYPNTKEIKGKYFNGTGGGGYWSLDYVDSIGRIIGKESYHKKQLMSSQRIVYDENNNKIFDIQTFDYNNPKRVDTFRYEYKYSNNRIIYQVRKLSANDSTVTELVENQGDTLLKFQERAFYYRPKGKTTDVYETNYTLRYRDNYLIGKEEFDKDKNSTEINKYEYYDNGRLKRRLIERLPKPEQKSFYVGGPGSDDESYEYKLDSQGRILKYFKVVNGTKFKMAVKRYT